MNYIGKFISNFKEFYNEINSATLTGAIDVIIVKQPDGTYLCSPFHVRFGKIGVLRSREKVVDIEVNGRPVNIHMKLGESGEAFFVEEVDDGNEIPVHLATSPLPLVPDIGAELQKLKFMNEDKSVGDHAEKLVISDHVSIDIADTENEQYCPDRPPSCLPSALRSSDDEEEAELNLCNKSSDEETISKDNTPVESQDENKVKRRKRKRVSAKKRGKGRESSNLSTLTEKKLSDHNTISNNSVKQHLSNDGDDMSNKHEDIFHMDIDYGVSEEDEGYPCGSQGLSRSVSLPLNGAKLFRKMSVTFTGEFHPFSDGDVTPQSSPTASRPPSPKSDTEYENQKLEALHEETGGPSWGWGQLPTNVPSRRVSTVGVSDQDLSSTSPNADDENKVTDTDDAEKRSMLGGMLNFMRSTKKMRHMPESEGIYLDSINTNSLDPEVAALYFPKFRSVGLPPGEGVVDPSPKDEDTESGKGPSLPHSPHSVEGAIGGPFCHDSDCDDRQSLFDCYNDVAMSLCGGLNEVENEFPEERFMTSLVTYDSFTETPSILLNPNLVVRIGGKFYNWQTAAPILMSMILFQRPLPEKTTNLLINEYMPKKKKSKSYSSWWSWRRSEVRNIADSQLQLSSEISEDSDSKISGSPPVVQNSNCDNLIASTQSLNSENSKDSSPTLITFTCRPPESATKERDEELISKPLEINIFDAQTETQVTLTQPSSGTSSARSSPVNVRTHSSQLKDELTVPVCIDIDSDSSNVAGDSENAENSCLSKEKYKKSLRLTPEQISSLDLKNGPNEVVFSVTTAYQGTCRCKCDIYLWNYDDKIVISDIDGTITKSDVLGHILPMVGKDWAQLGVAKLFTKIKNNGYQFLYLSARAIGQARITRDYLRSIRQGQVCLPDGPLLLSPTSLISALHREVIEKKPEEFKISCLKDIQTLFPFDMGNPFYSGFGNKINDTWAYRAVGIPTTRVFTINHRGELKLELIQTFQSSYVGLSDRVDHIFPPLNHNPVINGRLAPSFTGFEEFSYFTYWREPIKTISDDDELPV